ncbi:MAG: hypothetical protein ACI31M_02840 [Bacilli bacterium]
MKNNIDFNKLKFMNNQLRNYIDYLANLRNMIEVITEYNLLLSDTEIHQLTQIFIDIEIFSKSLLHFNQSLEKFNNIIQERIEER